MKHPVFARRAGSLVLVWTFLAVAAFGAADKPIRLRNPISATGAAAARSLASAPESGLFIIQFRDRPKPEWREQLGKLGVALLHYVPDDAYIAQFKNVRRNAVASLPFIQFVGEYRAGHKLHRSLATRKRLADEDVQDVAVLLSPGASESEIKQAAAGFQQVEQETRLRSGRVLRGRLTSAQLDALAASGQVLWIEPSRRMKLNDEIASKIVAGNGGPNRLETQALGYDGSGVTVAVADSGLNNGDAVTMHPDLLGRTPAFFHYGIAGQLADAADEHSHGTHVAGIIAGNGASGEVDENGNLYGLGVAPGAGIIAQRIFDGVGNYAPPPSYEKLTRDAKRAGADIGSNSWGDDTQGRYDLSAMEFDELVRDADGLTLGDQPYILEFSAGNAGPGQQTIGSPAVAKNVIATGASQNDRVDFVVYADGPETMADFSSRGPCEDGRIKPDVVAPGTWIASLQSESATDEYAWSPISPLYQYQGGTSQAGPHVSGAAAVFVQFYRATHTNATPSPALVKAALINSAVDLDNPEDTAAPPNNDEGWGRVDLTQLIGSARTFDFVDQSVLLTNLQVFERKLLVASGAEPLKVTLAYTDEPGFPGAIPALVNDLDLEVIAPNGDVYRGNQFDNGESIPNAAGSDRINNVEGVFISAPRAGEFTVRVFARSVVADARGDTAAFDQDFALVVSGSLAAPGASVAVLDRNAYRAPDTIKVSVYDKDRAGDPTVNVLLRSTTEASGENYSLAAVNGSGTFSGNVSTATGAAVADGKLQIAHNDVIEAVYLDASAGSSQTASATADLVPPVITSVATTNQFGQIAVSWLTDEPANSIVWFNTNTTLTRVATNLNLTTDHAVSLAGLIAGQTYFYRVTSTDEAGNATTNGTTASFVAPTVASVLLVDDYTDLLFAVPPLSGYTTPLTELGISHDVWDTAVNGSPTLTNLLSYRCVIWRLPEFTDTWTLAEQNALSDYLRNGGSLFVASMEVLSRLEEGGFNSAKLSILHAQSFIVDNDPGDVPDVIGAANNPVGNGIDTVLDYTPYEDEGKTLFGIPSDVSDSFTPDTTAEPVFWNSYGETIGMKYPRTGSDSPGRVVFLSFPLDAVPAGGTTNNRAHLLRNVLEFLLPGFDGRATIALDQSAYGIPGRVLVELTDADRAGSGTLTVNFSSATETNAALLTLFETARAGVFRGFFELIAATNAPATGKLRVANGDTLFVRYPDASSGRVELASATVDAILPAITSVAATPDYESATISWDTTEPCDSLVQFGASQFLDRSASDPTLTTAHEITLGGLQPDTTYYFQVVSRDAAGNVAVSDNNSNYFTVHTLVPLVPPWSDNLDTGATNWTTSEADGSQSHWTLGVPANGVQTAAHSPPHCWGSSLNGDALDYTEAFLISPAIQLAGGNSARLTFWHHYDFSEKSGGDVFETGTLYIVTGGGSQSAALAQYVDTNFDWEQETIDLSPYAGQVVYFVWAHQLFSFDIASRAGWLVDDVAVTVTNVAGGTIQVTNNIWQANFFLSGPAYRNGKGKFLNLTNTPPGEYVIEFADVLFYNAPPPQTNTLASGGTIHFAGNYTFTDANSNGIPDGWEAQQFNTVASTRTQTTDTDRDGLSDWAEFVAGTDPNNPPPSFRLTAQRLAGNLVQLSWPSVTNHSYRVHASTNTILWTVESGWFASAGTNTSYTVATTNGPAKFFRIEAAAAANSPVAGTFRVSASLLINKQVRLEWPSAPGHGYRILGSSNGTSWSPFSDWIRATGYTTGLTLPPPTNGAPYLFRIEAQP